MEPLAARLAPLAVLPMLSLGGCGERQTPAAADPLDPVVYVDVMADLAHLDRYPPAGPSREAEADSLRREILDSHGVTAEELLAFADHAGADPERMEEIAERIGLLVDSLAGENAPVTPAAGAEPAAQDTAPTISDLRRQELDRRFDSLKNARARSR